MEDQIAERNFIESQFILVQNHYQHQEEKRYLKIFSMQNTKKPIFKKSVKGDDSITDMISQFMYIKQDNEQKSGVKQPAQELFEERSVMNARRSVFNKKENEQFNFESDKAQEIQQQREEGQVILQDYIFTFVMLANNKIFHLIYNP